MAYDLLLYWEEYVSWQTGINKAKSQNRAVGLRPIVCCFAEPQLKQSLVLCCRSDQARGVMQDVDNTLDDFDSAEKNLSNIEDKVQDSTDLTNGLKTRLLQVGHEERRRTPQLHFVAWH